MDSDVSFDVSIGAPAGPASAKMLSSLCCAAARPFYSAAGREPAATPVKLYTWE